MQVYLLGTENAPSYEHLLGALRQTGHEVVEQAKTVNETDTFLEQYQRIQNTIITADAVVADESALDQRLRYSISMSLEHKKPTLIIIPKKSDVIHELLDLQHKKLTLKTYDEKEEAQYIITDFLETLKSSLDAKMFMIIPPTVNKYLDWVVANTEKSKSDVVRSAVEGVAEKDRAYQTFLKSLQ